MLDLIKDLREKYNTAMLLITHDMGVVAQVCDEVAVIYAGTIVEYGTKEQIFDHPTHPYTIGLIASIPPLDREVETLSVIPGSVPMLYELPEGCLFAPRCPYATEKCRCRRPDITTVSPGHDVRCFRYMPDWEGE